MKNKENKPTEKRSYQKLYFVVSLLLLLVTVWTWYDEMFTRRPWKMFQKTFYKNEYEKAKEELAGKGDLVAKKQNLLDRIKQVDQGLAGNQEYQQVKKDLNEAEIKLFDVKQDQKFAKSRLDEAYYYFKHALHEGENWQPQKVAVDEIEKEISSFDPAIKSAEAKVKELETKVSSITSEKKKLEKEYESLNMEVELLNLRMKTYRPNKLFYKIPEISQVVINGFDVNAFGEPLQKVDRCMTCHITFDNKSYANEKHPLKTHPNQDVLIDKHKTTKFGCTVCHKGQGPAISEVGKAHGYGHDGDHTIGLNEPLLKGDFMQSNCRNCHDNQMNLDGAPVLSEGKELFVKLGCHGCHMVKNYESLEKVGPRLTRLGSKVDPSWLYRWAKKPKDYLPETRMPFFDLSDEDALAVTSYLMSASEKDYKLAYVYNGSGIAENGKKIFETIGCLGCHTVNERGEKFGPDLSRINNKVSADWLYNWLFNPKHYNEKTKMPAFRFSEAEANDVTAYLLTLGKKEEIGGLNEKIKSPEFIKKGELVIKRRGCFACHEISGMEKESRIAPELTTFGVKRILELEFGDSKIEHDWEAWARTKLKNPSAFRTDRVLDKMPNFDLSDKEINSLVVFLKSLNGANIPKEFARELNLRESEIEKGRALVRKFNCVGCHIIEGKGGFIARFFEKPSDAPPPLDNGALHEGEKVQGAWLFAFLKKPEKIRPWLDVRMPTFYFTDAEVSILTRYFAALAKSETIFDYVEQREINKDLVEAAKKLMSKDYYDCFYCHSFGLNKPSGPPSKWAPNLANVRKRLRPDWIGKWISGPDRIQPGTKMPNFFEMEDEIPKNILDGKKEKHVEALMEYLLLYGG